MKQELLDYIHRSLGVGYTEEQIKSNLQLQGWNSNSIDEAFASIRKQTDNLSAKLPKAKKKFSPKLKPILITIISLAIIIAIGISIYWYQHKAIVDQEVFKNATEVFNKLEEVYDTKIKSYIIKGYTDSLEINGFKKTISTSFSGQITLPRTLYTKSNVRDTVKYTNKDPETRTYNNESIMINDKLFKRYDSASDEEWQLEDVFDNPLYESLGEGIDNPIYETFKNERKQALATTTWLIFIYAKDLSYIGKMGDTHHYQIIPKEIEFTTAVKSLRNNFHLTTGPGVTSPAYSLIEGEIWINDKYQIVKEKLFIADYPSEEYRKRYNINQKEGLEVGLEYSNYNESFDIRQPIDTTSIDQMYQDIREGKDPSEAEAEYKKDLYEQNPDLAVKQRNEQRFRDMLTIISNLSMHYDVARSYPPSLAEFNFSTGEIPKAPVPPDGNCTEEQNQYKYTLLSPTSYRYTFCLGVERKPLPVGFQELTEKGIRCIGEPKDKPYYCLPPNRMSQ